MLNAQEKISQLKTRFNLQVAGAVLCGALTTVGAGYSIISVAEAWPSKTEAQGNSIMLSGAKPRDIVLLGDKKPENPVIEIVQRLSLAGLVGGLGVLAVGGFAAAASQTQRKIQSVAYFSGLPSPK